MPICDPTDMACAAGMWYEAVASSVLRAISEQAVAPARHAVLLAAREHVHLADEVMDLVEIELQAELGAAGQVRWHVGALHEAVMQDHAVEALSSSREFHAFLRLTLGTCSMTTVTRITRSYTTPV